MNEFWNSRYADAEYAYGTEPNEFLKQYLADRPTGSILLPAEGEGRNAVYAAKLGWEVHAFDLSTEGKRKALELAEKNGVTIHYDITDFEGFTTDVQFDVVAFIYTHLDPKTRRDSYRRMLQFLKPGGQMVLELFTPDQLGKPSGGPKQADWLVTQAELSDTFSDLQIDLLQETDTILHEGQYHEGAASVVRLVGRKK